MKNGLSIGPRIQTPRDHELDRRTFLSVCGAGLAHVCALDGMLVRVPPDALEPVSGRCGFCRQTDAGPFIVGCSAARICHGCIDLCADIMEAARAQTEQPADAASASCTFCRAAAAEAAYLVAGPDLIICDRCVTEAQRVFARHGVPPDSISDLEWQEVIDDLRRRLGNDAIIDRLAARGPL